MPRGRTGAARQTQHGVDQAGAIGYQSMTLS